MRILWHSTSPICQTGYGNVTREVIRRLRAAGHFIRVATKHGDKNFHTWDGFEIVEGIDTLYMNQMIEDERFDYIFTMWDIWQLDKKRLYPKEKWVAHVPVDTEWISKKLLRVVKEAGIVVGMSNHGVRELVGSGIQTLYAPIGIDTSVFRPKPEGRKAFREYFGWGDDTFLIGSVGLNYSDDRKGFLPLMRAFKEFHGRHPEARLYIHSLANERDNVSGCINYHEHAVSLGIDAYLAWPNQPEYALGRIGEEQLCDAYNAMDVFCLPSKGEGFGIPIVEAQACGVPVIVTATTSCPELCFSGWTISVDEVDDSRYTAIETYRLEPRPSKILSELEKAYYAWKGGSYQAMKEKARDGAVQYDWDNVWLMYWEPLVKHMEDRLDERG